MKKYLTRAPVAIETAKDVGKSYEPYMQFYRAPTHAAYSNGYRMSPYHKTGYGPQQFAGFSGSAAVAPAETPSLAIEFDLGTTTLAVIAASVVVGCILLKKL